jgi:hypothetical protein
MPKFRIVALVGTRYSRVIEVESREEALEEAAKVGDTVSPDADLRWHEEEVDSWTEVQFVHRNTRARPTEELQNPDEWILVPREDYDYLVDTERNQ